MPEAKTTTTRSTRHQRYLSFFKWLVMDVTRSQWRRSLTSGILGFAGKIIQPTAIALGLYYAGKLVADEPFKILQWTFQARSEKTLLFMVALSLMVLFAASALCQYFSRRFALDARRNYSEHCTSRLLDLAGQGTFGSETSAKTSCLMKLAKGNTIYCGRIAYLLTLAAPEAVISVVALGALLFLEPLLTLELAVVSVAACFFLYRTNLKASAASIQSDRFSPLARKAIHNELVLRTTDDDVTHGTFDDDDWKKWLIYFTDRIRAVEEGALIVGLATAALLAIMMFGLVHDMMNDNANWTRASTYLVAFMVCAMQLRTLSRRCVSINRFYPQAREYWNAVVHHSISVDKMADVDNEDEDEE